jgi:hypothetical protein
MPSNTIIDWSSPWEWRQVTAPDSAAGAVLSIPITGFAWWLVVSFQVRINNTAGVATTQGLVSLLQGGTFIASSMTSVATGVGGNELAFFGPWLPNASITPVFRQSALPLVPIIGDGSIQIASSPNIPQLVFQTPLVVVVGKLFRPGRT